MTVDIETPAGRLRGQDTGGIRSFRGVPYAASVGGHGRLQRAVRLAPWAGILDCMDVGPSCPQPLLRGMGPMSAELGEVMSVWLGDESHTSEDCLVLNVWTPTVDDRPLLPVMVFLHGGGFTHGSASWPVYDGQNLARRAGAVVVTVNHRLGVLGHLHLADLADDGGGAGHDRDYAESGNVGLLDIVASLEWISSNVGAFGGDPANVTIFGESGGAAKAAFLLAMPEARGLFDRAVFQSHPLPRGLSRDEATRLAANVLSELGIARSQLHTLDDVPLDRLLEAQRRVLRRSQRAGGHLGGITFGPVVDGAVLPHDPRPALESGAAAGRQLLIGGTADETTLFHRQLCLDLDFDGFQNLLVRRAGPRSTEIADFYRRSMPSATPSELFSAATNDMTRIGGIRLAEAAVRGGSAVFMYLLTWESTALGAYHGIDLPLVFDNPHAVEAVAQTPKAHEMAALMSGAWGEFARSGTPATKDLDRWPEYTIDRRATLVFDSPWTVVDDPHADRRGLWSGVYLDTAGDLV